MTNENSNVAMKPEPRPEVPDLSMPFWEAARDHKLIIPRCRPCNRFFWYPREACPNCLESDSWEWQEVSGNARLHTFTIVYQPQHPAFQEDVPYVFAIVQLDEGVRLMSNVVDLDIPEDVEIDMRLRVKFDDVSEDWTLVKFAPA